VKPTKSVYNKFSDLSKKVLQNFDFKRGLSITKTVVSPRDNKQGGNLTRTTTNSSKNNSEILQILAKSQPQKDSLSVPIEFPSQPPLPGEFDKAKQTEDEYKEYMRKKLNQQNWENALIVYHRKEQSRDYTGMAAIIFRLISDMGTNLPPVSDIPTDFPSFPSFYIESNLNQEIMTKHNNCKKNVGYLSSDLPQKSRRRR